MKCIKRSPQHPEANKTKAVVETGKGDKEKAKKTIAEAIKGSFSEEAKRILRFLDPQAHYWRYIKPRVKVPEYFSPYKFELPFICRNRQDIPRALGEVDAYQKAMGVLIQKYAAITSENFILQANQVTKMLEQQQAGNKVNPGLLTGRKKPLFNTASSILSDLEKEFNSKRSDIDKRYNQLLREINLLIKQHENEFKQLEDAYKKRQDEYSKTHEGPSEALMEEECKTKNDLFNNYQSKYITLTENIQHQSFQVWADHINDISFWLYLSTVTKTQFKELFARYAASYLAWIRGLSELSWPAFRYCGDKDFPKQNKEVSAGEPECPVNLEILVGVGKININCESFELELGEGVLFGYEKNFKTGTSTIAFGAGVSIGIFEMIFNTSTGMEIPYAPLELGAKQQFYITFDRDNSISDLGVLWEAEADIKGMNKPDAKVNMKLGMMSGTLEIDEGPLKPIADKIFGIQPEQQINKNVQMYNKSKQE